MEVCLQEYIELDTSGRGNVHFCLVTALLALASHCFYGPEDPLGVPIQIEFNGLMRLFDCIRYLHILHTGNNKCSAVFIAIHRKFCRLWSCSWGHESISVINSK